MNVSIFYLIVYNKKPVTLPVWLVDLSSKISFYIVYSYLIGFSVFKTNELNAGTLILLSWKT